MKKVLIGIVVLIAIITIGGIAQRGQIAATNQKAAAVKAGEQALNVIEDVNANANLSTFAKVAQEVELADKINASRESYTVFAPTDEAFKKLSAETSKTLFEASNKTLLNSVALYHVVLGRYSSKDLTDGLVLKTIGGEELTITNVKGQISINGKAAVVSSTVDPSSKGILNVIDTVLVPKSIQNGNGIVVGPKEPVTNDPPASRDPRRYLICEDNGDTDGDGRPNITVTTMVQNPKWFFFWGSWHVESTIEGNNADGCWGVPGYKGLQVATGNPVKPTYLSLTKEDLEKLLEEIVPDGKQVSDETVGKRIPETRIKTCTDNGGTPPTVTIQKQIKKPILFFFWGSWRDNGSLVTQNGTCDMKK